MNTEHVIDFLPLHTLAELARALGIDADLLTKVTESSSRREFYVEHKIPKRNRKRHNEYRTVWQVRDRALADAHKALNRRFDIFLRDVIPDFPHKAAHGYVRGRSTRTNAEVHCGSPLLLRADIQDFFPTISAARLNSVFRTVGLQPEVAKVLASFATIDDSLPLGLHSSPLLANLVCAGVDDRLQSLAVAHGCHYTRYADDLAFSGERSVPTRIDVESELAAEGFTLSPRKFRVTKLGQAHFVTGLSVSDPKGPHIPKALKRRLRQELYFVRKYGLRDHIGRVNYSSFQSGINKIDGMLRYVGGIERKLGKELRAQWLAVLTKEKSGPSYAPQFNLASRPVTFYVDETEMPSRDGKILALACVAMEEITSVADVTKAVLRRYHVDPFTTGRKKKLKGLHYADSPEELRADYVRELGSLPIRAYVAYDLVDSYIDYRAAYLSLLGGQLASLFVGYDRAEVRVVFEENSQVTLPAVTDLVTKIYRELETKNSKRPLALPSVVNGKKGEEPNLAVPDYLLGVFGAFAAAEMPKPESATDIAKSENAAETARKRFERLRDKYRLIRGKPERRWYSRKVPFSPWPDGSPKGRTAAAEGTEWP